MMQALAPSWMSAPTWTEQIVPAPPVQRTTLPAGGGGLVGDTGGGGGWGGGPKMLGAQTEDLYFVGGEDMVVVWSFREVRIRDLRCGEKKKLEWDPKLWMPACTAARDAGGAPRYASRVHALFMTLVFHQGGSRHLPSNVHLNRPIPGRSPSHHFALTHRPKVLKHRSSTPARSFPAIANTATYNSSPQQQCVPLSQPSNSPAPSLSESSLGSISISPSTPSKPFSASAPPVAPSSSQALYTPN